MTDFRRGPLSPAERSMLEFAIKLTSEPASMGPADVEGLRQQGFDDEAVHAIAQITALFNYYNRLADGLGISGEPEWDG